jgi:predicted Rossmann-fold nucleotide-binding protein
MPVVLVGGDYWNEVINFEAMVRHGTISAGDLDLMHRTDSVDEAFQWVTAQLLEHALGKPGAML